MFLLVRFEDIDMIQRHAPCNHLQEDLERTTHSANLGPYFTQRIPSREATQKLRGGPGPRAQKGPKIPTPDFRIRGVPRGPHGARWKRAEKLLRSDKVSRQTVAYEAENSKTRRKKCVFGRFQGGAF